MHIGIEAQRIFRKKKHGMDIYALELIKALQLRDKENTYTVFVKKGDDLCLVASANLNIMEVKGYTYADWEQVWLPKAIKASGVDLVHFTSNTASLFSPVPYVLTLHDVMYLHTYTGGSLYQSAGHFYRKWIVPFVFKKAEKVLTVSAYEQDTITRLLGSNPKLSVSYNGIDPKFHVASQKLASHQIIEKYKLPENYAFVLGNMAPKKNLERILLAFALMKSQSNLNSNFKLVIADLSKETLTTILKKLSISEVKKDIQLTGYIPHDHLPYVYREALFFLYPSLQESFGIPVIEAMAAGTPVLTSNCTALPEVAADAALYVNPLSVEELTKGIQKLYTSEKLRQYLIAKGLKRAQDFSWKITATQTLQIYNSIF